jgi:hypothetical protein
MPRYEVIALHVHGIAGIPSPLANKAKPLLLAGQ